MGDKKSFFFFLSFDLSKIIEYSSRRKIVDIRFKFKILLFEIKGIKKKKKK